MFLIVLKIILLHLFCECFSDQSVTKAKDLRFTLHSGDIMPLIGLGTSKVVKEEKTKEVLDYALAAGYRLFDTAAAYNNEEEIGKALKELLPKHNVTRQDIFITTKLQPSLRGNETYAAIEASLKKLDTDYIDLYLIHWPGLLGINRSSPENKEVRDERWQEMVKGVKNGLIKNIGVSNYNIRHLKELLENDHGVKPALNQVEWHPFNHNQELLDFCKKERILLQAFYSLGKGNKDLLENIEVKNIAEGLGKTPAQVLLRWSLQQNVGVIPKASSEQRLQENIELDFIISEEDMKTLNSFSRKRYAWDPNSVA